MKCMWSILCESISINQETNLVSYLTCIHGVVTHSLPVSLRRLYFGSTWMKEVPNPEILNVRLVLGEPNGSRQILLSTGSIEVKEDNHHFNFVLDGMPIKETGFYVFILEMEKDANWIEVANIPFRVRLIAREEAKLEKV